MGLSFSRFYQAEAVGQVRPVDQDQSNARANILDQNISKILETGQYNSILAAYYCEAVVNVARDLRYQSPLYNLLAMCLNATIVVTAPYANLKASSRVVPQGITRVRDIVSNEQGNSILTNALGRIINLTFNASAELINRVMEAKNFIIRNPSEVPNMLRNQGGIRKFIESSTASQARAVSNASGKRYTQKRNKFSLKGNYCLLNGIQVCCICGYPFDKSDSEEIEHVISAIELGKSGILPATQSWRGFINEYKLQDPNAKDNWLENVISMFPKEEQEEMRNIIGLMILMAHKRCNGKKGQKSPFGCRLDGVITGDINQPFSDMTEGSYANAVIISARKERLNKKNDTEQTTWLAIQGKMFTDLAKMLNKVDARNNEASWQVFSYMWDKCKEEPEKNIMFRLLLVDLISSPRLTETEMHDILKSSNDDFARYIVSNKLAIMTIITMIGGPILLEVISNIHAPTTELDEGRGSNGGFVLQPSTEKEEQQDKRDEGDDDYDKEEALGYEAGLNRRLPGKVGFKWTREHDAWKTGYEKGKGKADHDSAMSIAKKVVSNKNPTATKKRTLTTLTPKVVHQPVVDQNITRLQTIAYDAALNALRTGNNEDDAVAAAKTAVENEIQMSNEMPFFEPGLEVNSTLPIPPYRPDRPGRSAARSEKTASSEKTPAKMEVSRDRSDSNLSLGLGGGSRDRTIRKNNAKIHDRPRKIRRRTIRRRAPRRAQKRTQKRRPNKKHSHTLRRHRRNNKHTRNRQK